MQFVKLNPDTAFDEAINSLRVLSRILVVGEQRNLSNLKEALEYSNDSTQDIIAKSAKLNAIEWLAKTKTIMLADLAQDDIDFDEMMGQWNGESGQKSGYSLATDILTQKPIEDLNGIKVKVEHNWHIPALLKYGGWNKCPSSEVHCMLWQYWEAKYQAKIVGISHDTIEAHVANPPVSKEEAIELAIEQYLYCNDIVDQGCESIANLASSIMNSNVWFFWWD